MERGGTFVPSLSINIQERVTSIYREVTCVAFANKGKSYSFAPPYNYYINGKKYLEKVLSVLYVMIELLFREALRAGIYQSSYRSTSIYKTE